MSDVYLAEDETLGRRVAVKVLSEAFSEDDAFRERFLREARTAARLGPHRRVVTVYDVGEWAGRPYIVMELIEAGTLADRISDKPPDRATALAWLAQTAEALDAAHADGIVHRDVKPANLLLDDQGEVRIADLGLACPELAGSGLTPPGGLVGTAGYLAPEVEAGGKATAATDNYALAVVACELLAGKRPADGRAPKGVPREATAVIERNLSTDPSARYPSATAFVAALASALDDRPTRVLSAPAGQQPTRVLEQKRPRRRLRRAILFAAALTLTVAGGLTAVAIATGKFSSPPEPVAKPQPVVQRCTISPVDHDANLVAIGVKAHRFCRQEVAALTGQGAQTWVFRRGRKLRAPDYGQPEQLTLVCSLTHRGLELTVLDDGKQDIGTALCQRYA